MVSRTKLDAWLEGVIEAGWLAALVVAPLFFNVFSSRVFEPDKISLVRTIALIMLLAWLVKLLNGGLAWLPGKSAAEAPGETPPDATPGEAKPWWRRLGVAPLLLPVLFMVVAYLLSTGFSVARFVSWWGSYQRLQGTYTFLAYVIIAVLAMAHLRRPEQIRRIQHAIIVTSLPIAIYGVVQHTQVDPLPWGGDTTTRVAGNAGNAIFLAAYLIMALFFTLERVYSSFAYLLGYKPPEHSESQELPIAFAGGGYLFILMVQLLAIFWTQSRGPWLGLLFGLYLFVLLLFTALRPKRHRLWTSLWVGLGLAGALFLVVVNITPLGSGLRNVPYLGRLTTILESEGGTGRVRVLIWEGASKMVQPHEPLDFPDGSKDTVNVIRPLIGYGPEAMWIAYNPFYPPELAHVEARNASPDRSHNETWDSLVITGVFGFLAYLTIFVAIFYWALRWLGLLVNRRDTILYAALLAVASVAAVAGFYIYDGGWRFFGVALPAGLMLGLGAYVTLSAFIHSDLGWQRSDLPRQLLIITILATIAAHFIEIHFGIAIAATRTYFWVQTALLLVVGMGWATPAAYTVVQEEANVAPDEEPAATGRGRKRGRGARRATRRRSPSALPALPGTILVDLLIFLTAVFLYTTNGRAETNPFSILFGSIFQRTVGGEAVFSPAIFFLLFFTWLMAATLGLASMSLQQRYPPGGGWWLRGYLFHFLIAWGAWLVYGLVQASRLIPGVAGNTLEAQLNVVAGHFAFYTWLLVVWLLVAGTAFVWQELRAQRRPVFGNAAFSLGLGALMTVAIFVFVSTANIALVRADIIYKQGQQFDAQGNWLSSVELYRRALNARRTEDHYMLFLGRALLEQAKQAGAEGSYTLPEQPTLSDVLALTPEAVSQMNRGELLRAAEVVLREAQRVNPLNTDHTANLARLYRTWADLSGDNPELRSTMLDQSIAEYDMAVTLSPNAAHLWNEKGNAHLARGEDDLAEAAYLHSLELDSRYSQTYLLLADFYERLERYEDGIAVLQQGIAELPNQAQFYSYLGVAMARINDLPGAAGANLKVLELQPGNVGAMRNLAIIYRDMDDMDKAIEYVERALATIAPNATDEQEVLRRLAIELYSRAERPDQVLAQYEQLRQLRPDDADVMRTLYNLYIGQENWNAAVEVLQTLVQLEPDNYQHPLALAQILQQIGRPDEALAFANQALALAPDDQKAPISQLIDTLNTGS